MHSCVWLLCVAGAWLCVGAWLCGDVCVLCVCCGAHVLPDRHQSYTWNRIIKKYYKGFVFKGGNE